jgi:exopolyphosphatase / guanosine-5'-triphosphate,3'-diphosphate pyrophosphatase
VAAVNTTTLDDGVVLDIGGGSMQLTAVRDRRSGPTVSFPLGAVRVTEELLTEPDPTRPAKRKQLQRVRSRVEESLADVDWLAGSGRRLVGIGGAVRNLAAAAQHVDGGVDLGVQG